MPAEQAVSRKRLSVVLGGVEHHFDDALHVAISRDQADDIHAQTAGDGGADLVAVEDFALDLAGLQYVLGQGAEDGFFAQRKAQGLHPSDQPALAMADGGERLGKDAVVPGQVGPVGQFVDIGHICRISCGECGSYSPQGQGIIDANCAVNIGCIRRMPLDQAASCRGPQGCNAMDTPFAASGRPTRSLSRAKAVWLVQRMRRSSGSHLA